MSLESWMTTVVIDDWKMIFDKYTYKIHSFIEMVFTYDDLSSLHKMNKTIVFTGPYQTLQERRESRTFYVSDFLLLTYTHSNKEFSAHKNISLPVYL